MPIYEYRCSQCGAEFERVFGTHQKMTAAKIACGTCGSKRVKRLVSAPRVRSADATMTESFERADHEASTAPGANGLLGRKEIGEITKKRKKAGLE